MTDDTTKTGWFAIKELKSDKYRVCYLLRGKAQYTIMKDYSSKEEAERAAREKAERVIHP